jgi:hypothetical protein
MSQPCTYSGCARISRSRSLCSKHYQELRKNDPESLPPTIHEAGNACGHPDRPHAAKGLCHPCYMTLWNREHPDSNSGPGWLKRHPEQARVHRRRTVLKKHGMTTDDYAAAWAEQLGRCGNARCPYRADLSMPSYHRGLQVDHDHRTGAVRRLLCGGCNRALSCVDDDTERLAGLIDYLEMHSTK